MSHSGVRWFLACALLWMGLGGAHAREGHASRIGVPGVLETPSALMPAAGTLGFGFSNAVPYQHLYVNMQPLDWFNLNVRYNIVTDAPYHNSGVGLNTSYTDKALDVAVQLVRGRGGIPTVTAGLLDIGGTQHFGGEYLVASQRIFDLYASVGLAWGRAGAAADFANPLGELSSSFNKRPGRRDPGTGGQIAFQNWFRGQDVAVFGSLIWSPSAWPRWSLMAEWEGNDYSREKSRNRNLQSSRANFGIDYALTDTATISLQYIRGNQVGFQVGIQPYFGDRNYSRGRTYLPVLQQDVHPNYRKAHADGTADQLAELYDTLRFNDEIYLHAIDWRPDGEGILTVWQSSTVTQSPVNVLRKVGRYGVNIFDNIKQIRVITMEGGVGALTAEASKETIIKDAQNSWSNQLFASHATFGPGDGWGIDRARYSDLLTYPSVVYGINPSLRSAIADATGFFLTQLLVKPYATVQLTRGWSFTGMLGVNLLDGASHAVKSPSSPGLPVVRSDGANYLSQGQSVYLERLDTTFIFPIAAQWYGSFTAGILEEMYGGAGLEVIYVPFGRRWALGWDNKWVKKRAYDQRFDFLEYSTVTSHLNWYYRTPFEGVGVQVSAGRYLAGDVGATVDLYRTFKSGAKFGIYATKTNVSSRDFGEGSFDKGFYVAIPFGAVNNHMKNSTIEIGYSFLDRDGGQRVTVDRPLYGVFGSYHAETLYDQ